MKKLKKNTKIFENKTRLTRLDKETATWDSMLKNLG